MNASSTLGTERLEAFSDGVIAVIITVMVLDLRPPHGVDVHALQALAPTAAAYVLSYAFVGIYWNNHHQMLRAARAIDGRAMWANLHLLFWLSLAPFTTAWLGEHPKDAVPTALYGTVLLLMSVAYAILQRTLVAANRGTGFEAAVRSDFKGRAAPLIYLVAIGAAFVSTIVSDVLFAAVALMWLVPDRRFERVIAEAGD